ncbi:MAG: hypothetical protein PHU26_10410 [Methanofollis liminatans]|nr:hypothetical protein [Methanofollis liminatans]
MTQPSFFAKIKDKFHRADIPVGFLILPAGVLIFLFGLQYAICTQIIPIDVATHYLFMNLSAPSPSSFFLSHYVHDPSSPHHIIINALIFFFTVFCIFQFRYLILPALGWRSPPNLIKNTSLLVLFFLPFSLSGIAIIIGGQVGYRYGCGFSGIAAAFVGFLIFLIVTSFVEVGKYRRTQGKSWKVLFGIGAMSILLPVYFWISESGRGDTPLYVHVGGYIFGLIIPLILSLIGGQFGDRKKVILYALLGTLFLLPLLAGVIL